MEINTLQDKKQTKKKTLTISYIEIKETILEKIHEIIYQ